MASAAALYWFVFALLIWAFPLFAFLTLWRRFILPKLPFMEDSPFDGLAEAFIINLNLIFIGFSYVNGRHKPRILLGCHVKWVYNLIIVCTAITMRKCHGYDDFVVVAMVGFNAEFHALARLWNIVDVGVLDMFLGVLMQTIIFFMVDETYFFIVVLMLCGGIIYYQYCSYTTPTTCVTVLPKEEDLKNPNPNPNPNPPV